MNQETFIHIFKTYHSLVFRVAFAEVKNHADAEDILQEVFFRYLRYQPELESSEHERAWMIRTTLNLCKDYFKNKWNSSTVGMDKVAESEKVYFKLPYMEEDDTLWAVLELKERYRRPLYLFYYEDYSIKEIAQILHLSENTVKTNLRRGRQAVKELLDQENKIKKK